jgi:hypothetical protein
VVGGRSWGDRLDGVSDEVCDKVLLLLHEPQGEGIMVAEVVGGFDGRDDGEDYGTAHMGILSAPGTLQSGNLGARLLTC